MKFTELRFTTKLMKGIEEAGFEELMPVQEASFVHTLKGKDVTVQSQTGTGKTAAFLITIFHHFLEQSDQKNRKALILAPTRELAIQIEKEARLLGRFLDFSIGCFYGGVGYLQQEKSLQKGVDIIVGTPGRLLDFQNKGKVSFHDVGYLVIDEADRMFDMGFYPDIRRIMRTAAPNEKRQTMLFSATLDARTRTLAREFMNNPAKVEIQPEQVTVDKIKQRIYHVGRKEKLNLMLGILKIEAPRNALIFTNTKHAASEVAQHLEYNGFNCLHISGDLPQSKRLRVLNQFKTGKLPFLVATDVAARGLHIDDLEMVFNYDLPGDCENYVHRIGRTARAGKSGIAISLVCEEYVYNLDAIETYVNYKIPVAYADDEFFQKSKSEGMHFTPGPRNARGEKKHQGKPSSARQVRQGGLKSRFQRDEDRMKKEFKEKRELDAPPKNGELKTPPEATAAAPERPKSDTPRERYRKGYDKPRDEKRRDGKPRDDKRPDKSREDRPKDDKTRGEKPRDEKARDDRYRDDKSREKRRQGSERNHSGSAAKTARSAKSRATETKKGSLEDRIEYYKKKYGDNFNAAEKSADAPRQERQSRGDRKERYERKRPQDRPERLDRNDTAGQPVQDPAYEDRPPLEDFVLPKKSIFKRVVDWLRKGNDG